MSLEYRPLDNVVRIQPQVKITIPDWWLRFSDGWPDDLAFVKGKTFRVSKEQTVKYPLPLILPEGNYFDIDPSDEDTGQKLYPYQQDIVYEVLIGMRPGNYMLQFYYPANDPIFRLDYATMLPNLTDPSLKYLGALRPGDSPSGEETIKIYFVYRMKPFYVRVIADDGVAYEKCVIDFTFNRLALQQAVPPPDVKPKLIPYLEDIKWLNRPGGGY